MHIHLSFIRRLAFTCWVLFSLPVAAAPLDPSSSTWSMLGLLPSGDLVVDTGTSGDAGSLPTLTFAGGILVGDVVAQAGGPDIAVFRFDGGSVFGASDLLTVSSGSRALALLFDGAALIEGTIDVSGGSGVDNSTTAGTGVAGGGNGGYGNWPTPGNGVGPGAGIGGSSSASFSGVSSGSGGGFGTNGGNGGAGVTGKAGGSAYGDLATVLEGGSGGGAGGAGPYYTPGAGGGAGGGALEIGDLTDLDLAGATILANGGDTGSSTAGNIGPNGGGGSGGGILLHAFDVSMDLSTVVQANGGSGGVGAVQGGCGGAGRVRVVTNTEGSFTNNGTAEAVGGAGCQSGSLLATSQDDVGAGSATPPTGVPAP
ncbi:MAG: hypothetical protein KDI19_06110, partial [Pseudomonadales bacterium]|nr:hypothetical protein [Pseudomonadales bacterium]